MRYYLKTLGGLSLHDEGPDGEVLLGSSKSLALAAYLATAARHSASRSHLAELFWPDVEESRARRSLRQAIYYLSTRAGSHLLEPGGGRLRLDSGRVTVDVWRFDAALADERWEEAVELCRGPFLAGFDGTGSREFEHWVEARRERTWGGLKVALHRLVAAALERGETEEAVARARRLTEVNPLDEAAQTALITALLARGDRIAALQTYESYRTLLATELGDSPGRELASRVSELREALYETPDPPPAEHRPESRAESPAEDRDAPPAAASAGGQVPGGPEVAPVPDGGPAGFPDGSRETFAAVATGAEAAEGTSAGGTERTSAGRTGEAAADAADRAEAVAVAARRLSRRDAPRWFTLGAVAGVVVAVVGVALWSAFGGISAEAADEGVVADLYASFGPDGLQRLLVADSQVVALEPTDLPADALVSPSGRRAVWGRPVAEGTDLFVRPLDGGPAERLTRRPDDEHPLAWAPDERRVLYWFGESTDGGHTYHRRLAVHDLEARRSRPLPSGEYPQNAGADWSPDGSRVAVASIREGDTAVVVLHPDGSDLRVVGPHRAWDGHPAWSPDGHWLAFASRRNGHADIYIARPDGDGVQRVTTGLRDETHPRWISEDRIVYLSSSRGADRRLEEARLSTRRARPLSLPSEGTPRRLPSVVRPGREIWIEELRIAPRPDFVTPGQWIDFRPRLRDAGGEVLSPAGLPVRWAVPGADSAVMDGTTWWRVPDARALRVTAEIPGWRRDVLELPTRGVAERERPVLFREDWSGGLDRDRWRSLGDPPPRVVDGRGVGAPWPRVLDPAGDRHFDSGLISRRPFPTARGLTLEAWGRLNVTGGLWQQLALGLKRDPEPEGRPHWQTHHTCALGVKIHQDGPRTTITFPARDGLHLPLPGRMSEWRRYALQLSADGRAAFLVDGELFWRSEETISLEGIEALYATVGGRTVGAEVHHGPVTVYEGEKYVF